jgi:hypothetical protein
MGHALPRDGSGRAAEGPLDHPETITLTTTATNGIAPQHNGCPATSGSAEWRPVPGFTGFYACSADGGVASVPRRVECRDGRVKRLRGVELVATEGTVSLSRGGHRRSYTVSRLVGSAWRGTPCAVCAEVVSTRPPPWACSTCDYTPPRPVVEPVDLDAFEGVSDR